MLQLLLSSLLFFTQPTLAETDLTPVDAFLASDTFEVAFHRADLTIVETKSCLGAFCDAPYGTQFLVQEVSAERAIYARTKMDGTLVSQHPILRSDWMAMNQNRVRVEMKNLEQGGFRVSVMGIEASAASIHINGNLQTVQTQVVKLDAVSATGMKIQATLEVAPGLGGMGQLVRKVLSRGTLGTDTFTVLSVGI